MSDAGIDLHLRDDVDASPNGAFELAAAVESSKYKSTTSSKQLEDTHPYVDSINLPVSDPWMIAIEALKAENTLLRAKAAEVDTLRVEKAAYKAESATLKFMMDKVMSDAMGKVAFDGYKQGAKSSELEPLLSSSRPETAEKGISIAGLRKLEETTKRLCAEGRFAEDKTFDIFYHGTRDYSKLTTTQFVSMWVKDPAVTGNRRLADCPDLIDPTFIGLPSIFMSHAWRGSLASLLQVVFDFATSKNLPDETKVWLDMVAINQHKDTAEERAANMADVSAFKEVVKFCKGGTVVYLTNIPDDDGKILPDYKSTTANRGWCLYEWDWTLALHKDARNIHFRGLADANETLKALEKFDVGSSVCWSPMDKRRILEDMMKNHGSKVAFNEKLQRQLRENVVRESMPEVVQNGITVRGLRELLKKVEDLFHSGFFEGCERRTFESPPIVLPKVQCLEDVTTLHFVYLWVLDSSITRYKRLADCSDLINTSDLGVPSFLISNPWAGSFKKMTDSVFSFFKGASEDTVIWLDFIALNQWEEGLGTEESERQAQIDQDAFKSVLRTCHEGTLVVADMARCNPASRVWCLYEWDLTLQFHGPGSLHLSGLSVADRELFVKEVDVDKAVCLKIEGKEMIMSNIINQHGSTNAFNQLLKQQVTLPMPYKLLHAEKDLLLRRSQGDQALPLKQSLAQFSNFFDKRESRALCIISGPCTGKSTLSAAICQDACSLSAFHFLKKHDADSLDPIAIVKSLTSQLAPKIPTLQEHLGTLTPTIVDSLVDVADAIATLLSPLFSYGGNVLVVIDGLDEADSPSDPGRRGPSSNPIIEMLEILVPRASDSVRFVISTRSEPSFAQGKDVGAIIKAVFSDSVTFHDPQPRYSTCLTYHTVVTECHLMDHVPPLIGSASIEDVYAAFKVVFDRQPPKGQKTIDLLSILAASQRYLTIVMIEEMGFKRRHLEELPGWGSLFYDSIGRICMSRPFIDWIQSERVRMFGVDLNRGHALLGVHLLREVTDKGEGAGRYARDFSLFHQSQALSAGGLAMDQAMLRQLAEAILVDKI